MRRDLSTLDRIRPTAALLLLAVFLAAAQLLPATHLATHRDDHTHGPARPVSEAARVVEGADHAAAHRAGRPHGHDAPAATATPGAPLTADHDHDGPTGRAPHDHAPATPGDHGRASSAHFGLALLESPPPPFLPTPAVSQAPALDDRARSQHDAPALPQPPVRGPPRLS